jgi:flagellar biosynthesis/type III secretory pathway ATPase
MIAADMKHDATAFDGKPFNGKTVAEYFGNQGAAIAALADIVKRIVAANEARP